MRNKVIKTSKTEKNEGLTIVSKCRKFTTPQKTFIDSKNGLNVVPYQELI